MLAIRLPLGLALCAGLLVLPATANAEPDQVVVFPLAAKKLPRNLRKAPGMFTQFLAREAGRVHSKATIADANLPDTATLLGCDPTAVTCLDSVASTLNARELIFGRVFRGKKRGSLVVALTRHVPGKGQREITANLEPGTVVEQGEALATAAQPLLEAGVSTDAPTAIAAEPTPTPAPAPAPAPVVIVQAPPESSFEFAQVSGSTWAIAGTGAALAVAGGALLFLADGRRKDVDKAPTDTRDDLRRLEELESEGRTYSYAGTGLLAVGGVAVVTAAVLAIIQGNEPPTDAATEDGTDPKTEAGPVTLLPWFAASGGGLTMNVHW